jgi:AP-1 complex subunit gamma-1
LAPLYRYVALNTLNKVVAMDTNAVQRHRNIILDCLRDGDISIRRRSLELTYALINEANVRVLTRELLAFLEVSDNEFKLGLTTQISLAAEKFAPNRRWHIDTVLRVLKLAGNYVREEILSAFLRLICHTPELQAYTVQRLYSALHEDFSQEGLTMGAVWTIGEFGELLTQGASLEDEELVRDLKPSNVVDLISSLLDSPYANSQTRQWVLTALAKLAVRYSYDGSQVTKIHQILTRYETSVDMELQQRSVEFEALLKRQDIREGVLEAMPPPEIKTTMVGTVSEKRAVGSTRTDKDALLDLMGDEMPAGNNGTAAGGISNGSKAGGAPQSTQDLLADIFGGGDSSSMSAAATPSGSSGSGAAGPPGKASVNDILGLFGSSNSSSSSTAGPSSASNGLAGLEGLGSPTGTAASDSNSLAGLDIFGGSSAAAPSPAATVPTPAKPTPAPSPAAISYTAYDAKGLKITFTPKVSPARPDVVNILVEFTSSTDVEGVTLQAAVPKVSLQQERSVQQEGNNDGN